MADLGAAAGSWLCRGFLMASALLSVLMLKGMEAEQKAANQMLEALYSSYLVLWAHAVIFIAGAALSREQDCLNDAILSTIDSITTWLIFYWAGRRYFPVPSRLKELAVALAVGGLAYVPLALFEVRMSPQLSRLLELICRHHRYRCGP